METIKIPTFRSKYFRRVSICSYVDPKNSRLIRLIKQLPSEKPWLTSLGEKNPFAIILFAGGDGELGKAHLHINLVSIRHLIKKAPFTRVSLEKFNERFSPFLGAEVTARITANFFVPSDKLPMGRGVIAPAMLSVQSGDMEISQVGGRLSIKGGPVDSIDWRMRPDRKRIWVEIEHFRSFTIERNFLVKLLELSEGAFRLLVLGEQANAESGPQNR